VLSEKPAPVARAEGVLWRSTKGGRHLCTPKEIFGLHPMRARRVQAADLPHHENPPLELPLTCKWYQQCGFKVVVTWRLLVMPKNSERYDRIITGCPLDIMLGFLAQAWMADIIYALGGGAILHFGALRRAMPGPVSAKMLSRRVKDLENLGLLVRLPIETGRREVRYSLTEDGRTLDAAIRALEASLQTTPLPAALAARR